MCFLFIVFGSLSYIVFLSFSSPSFPIAHTIVLCYCVTLGLFRHCNLTGSMSPRMGPQLPAGRSAALALGTSRPVVFECAV